MDVASLAQYGLSAQQAMTQQKLQIAIAKQAQQADQAALELVTQATNATVSVPSSAEMGKGTIIDIEV